MNKLVIDTYKNYTNKILKKGLIENKDFIIVSHKVDKLLFNKYKG